MPRFSDIFVWEACSDRANGVHVFKKCRLIKRVDIHDKHTAFDEIVFDTLGMYLMFGTHGPYCLTVASP